MLNKMSSYLYDLSDECCVIESRVLEDGGRDDLAVSQGLLGETILRQHCRIVELKRLEVMHAGIWVLNHLGVFVDLRALYSFQAGKLLKRQTESDNKFNTCPK